MVAELATAMPVEGGFYFWVKKAMGPFWGFQEGWWSWLTTFVDMAIYPVLFVEYAASYKAFDFLNTNGLAQWLLGFSVIWVFTYLNRPEPPGVHRGPGPAEKIYEDAWKRVQSAL